ncbi:MAG: iron(III) transport system substrate-binding protein [Solirubrobacteraceae bacterium]|jgi:iron(III) transport system substrate-binding protein|nr:iron(III) transport system substrate-binding protein [Solirubrobacteraceae bacterium]MEA2289167.1 iron(III) transport system substrate-binding protein [Solirubrobacteraceae bacterium]
MTRRLLPILAVLAAVAGLAACGGDDGSGGSAGSGDSAEKLVVYSGRGEKLVGPLLADFEKRTGIDLQVRYGDSAELAATIAEEGDASPADVFFSQDAGALGAVQRAGLLSPLPRATLDRVTKRFQDPNGEWVGTSGRARVVAYSTERLKASELPDSIFDFTDPKWKGRIGFAPPNASFQAFVSAMRIDVGDARTKKWLEDIKRNEPTLLENNIQTEEAIAAGEIDVGFVNHYYVHELRAERPDFPVENHFLGRGDPGSLVNVAGAGIVKGAEHADAARRFVDFLLSKDGQQYFSQKSFEYPLIDGIAPPKGTRALEDVHGPDIALGDLGGKLPSTLQMLSEVGFAS